MTKSLLNRPKSCQVDCHHFLAGRSRGSNRKHQHPTRAQARLNQRATSSARQGSQRPAGPLSRGGQPNNAPFEAVVRAMPDARESAPAAAARTPITKKPPRFCQRQKAAFRVGNQRVRRFSAPSLHRVNRKHDRHRNQVHEESDGNRPHFFATSLKAVNCVLQRRLTSTSNPMFTDERTRRDCIRLPFSGISTFTFVLHKITVYPDRGKGAEG